jgi:hypothetical protein
VEQPETMDRLERILQRSTQEIIQEGISSKFKPENWYQTRYSDGTWAVLYTAEAPQTARAESLYHKRRFMAEELAQGPVQIDLRLVQLYSESENCSDLLENHELDRARLVSEDESGYPYCQDLARKYRQVGAELLRTPSARDRDGVCVPIFQRTVIKKDYGHLEYIKCVLSIDRTEIFEAR